MLSARVAIIGGGLSGLYAASLLEKRGIFDYVLLEARDMFGGRIRSVAPVSGARSPCDGPDGPLASGNCDLGATWFWPALQPELERLVGDLGLASFEQYEDGDMLLEQSGSHPAERVVGYRPVPVARRVAGGMGALVDALRHRLTAGTLVLGCRVRRLRRLDEYVEVLTGDAPDPVVSQRVGHVLLAVPPRLAVHTIDFMPRLPDALAQQWQGWPTWMAPHAKYVAVFDKAFWREQGLSGAARSARGPLVEIHDASAPDGHAALFGFMGLPAQERSRIPEAGLLAACRAQLVRLFGDDAGTPRAELLKDWAGDPYTAVAADGQAGGQAVFTPPSMACPGAWSGRLIGIASEWSPAFPGHLAGAVDAARRGVESGWR